ncbi:MAG: rhodanese-like domain-containing protein [Candidatus Kariarchaeaceae archaeon]|jgi:rhodanese-related sulfurtransferase
MDIRIQINSIMIIYSNWNKPQKKSLVLLLIPFLVVSFSFHSPATEAMLLNDYTNLTVLEAHNIIENTSNLFLLDVRTEEEYENGHLIGSHLIPHDQITSRENELPSNKTLSILVYCRTGTRSAIASNTLFELNYTKVYNMLGGYFAWKEAGLPFEETNQDPSETLVMIAIVFSIVGFLVFSIAYVFMKGRK